MKKIKEKNKIITPIDIVYIIALALNVILYNTYSGIIMKILLFCGIMSVVMLLMYIFKYITLKEEKSKNIEKIIEINVLMHFIITQILIAQRCRCGYHYFYIIPLIILLIAEAVTYHIFCVNYKKEKKYWIFNKISFDIKCNICSLYICFKSWYGKNTSNIILYIKDKFHKMSHNKISSD